MSVASLVATVRRAFGSSSPPAGDVALPQGVVWLLLAATFVGIAVGLCRRSGWVIGALAAAGSLSAVACALEIKTAYAGLVIDLVVLLGLWSSRERLGKAHPAR